MGDASARDSRGAAAELGHDMHDTDLVTHHVDTETQTSRPATHIFGKSQIPSTLRLVAAMTKPPDLIHRIRTHNEDAHDMPRHLHLDLRLCLLHLSLALPLVLLTYPGGTCLSETSILLRSCADVIDSTSSPSLRPTSNWTPSPGGRALRERPEPARKPVSIRYACMHQDLETAVDIEEPGKIWVSLRCLCQC